MIASFAALAIATAMPGAPLANIVAAPVAQRGVDGRNVTRVFHDGPGSFEQLDSGRWVEFGDDGRLIHEFDERSRDRDRIELFDRARGVRVWIDLRTREIGGTPAFGAPRMLYRILDLDAGERTRGWRGRRGGGGNGGWNGGGNNGGGYNGGGRGNVRDYEVGPIWNQRDAETKCRNKARDMRGEWTGQWSTTVQGRMSVCEIRFR